MAPSEPIYRGALKSAIVDSERYLLTCSRYIELNPVRAGMVDLPQDYPWSSHRHNALGQQNSLLAMHSVYRRLGSDTASRRVAYSSLFRGDLGSGELEQIRSGTESGTVIGTDRFREQIEKVLDCRMLPLGHGGDRRSQSFRDQQL